MRRLTVTAAATIAAAAIVLASAPLSASAAPPTPQQQSSVSGVTSAVKDLALLPDGSRAYAVDQSAQLAVIDPATSSVIGHSIDFTPYGTPTSASPATDGSAVYVAADHWMITLNPDGTENSPFGLGPVNGVRAVAAVPGNSFVVGTSTNSSPALLYRFNLGFSYSLIPFAPAADPDTLTAVAVAADGRVFTVGSAAGSGVLYVFAAATALGGPDYTVTLPVTSADAVAVNEAGTRALVVSTAGSMAFLVDTSSGSVLASLPTPMAGTAAAFSPDGATAYVAGGAQLTLIDTASGAILATTPTGTTAAADLVVSPSGRRIWVADGAAPGAVTLLASPSIAAPATSGSVGSPLAATFTSAGFDAPVGYAVSPALPAGLTLDASTGQVTGTPTAGLVPTTYTVTATSADGLSASTSWQLGVALAATGANATTTAVALGTAAALLVGGAVLIVVQRRRVPGRGAVSRRS